MPLANSIGGLFKKGVSDYPVLLCGLSCAGKSTLLNKWKTGDGSVPVTSNIAIASIEVPGGAKITFRDIGLDDVEDPNSRQHSLLNLGAGDSGLLFVHDADDACIEDSLLTLHRYVNLLLHEHGGRGVWVIINKQDKLDKEDAPRIVADLRARFELELSKYREDFRWHVLDLPGFSALYGSKTQDALRILAEELKQSPPVRPHEWESGVRAPGDVSGPRIEGLPDVPVVGGDAKDAKTWWLAFMSGTIAPWTHRDYLRGAFLTLLLPENRERGILEVATNFASRVFEYKKRHANFTPHPESRTLTVFWLYHVKLAMDFCRSVLPGNPALTNDHFQAVLEKMPELLIEKLPQHYFSSDLLRSKDSERYWMLPDLHSLTQLPRKPDPKLGQQMTLKQTGDPDLVLRFAFAVVQRYLRGDSSRRRSWFIDLGFGALQQHLIRLRTIEATIPAYSLTHAYFFVQLTHVALSQLLTSGTPSVVIQEMSFPVFKELCRITPTAWTKYYSPKKWYSLEARAAFLPPDLKPGLPTLIEDLPIKNITIPSNEVYKHRGLIPELPDSPILKFHLAIILEDARTLPQPITPANVTNHASLLAYIVRHLTQPGPTIATPANIDKHLDLLTASSPLGLSFAQASFWISQVLLAANSTILPISPYPGSPISTARYPPLRDSYRDESGTWHRFHNCPCHANEEMSLDTGPNAVQYPHNYPYEHAPQFDHACACHLGVPLHHDSFAERCADAYALREEWEKESRGLRARPSSLSKDPWENFVRFNVALVWEGLWEEHRESSNQREEDKDKDDEVTLVGKRDEGSKDGKEEGRAENTKETESDIADEKLKARTGTAQKAGEKELEEEDDDEWEVVS